MHHALVNIFTGCRAVDCGRKNGVSGQPNAVAARRFVSTNDRNLSLSKDCLLGESIGGGRSTVDGIPVGVSERVSV